MREHSRESATQAIIWAAIGSRPDCRLFRNNVGQGWCGQTIRSDSEYCLLKHPRRVVYGLTPGSADLIGWRSVTITPEMVGRTLAVFLSVEAKSSTGTARDDQEQWRRQVIAAGGLAGVARTVEDAEKIIEGV